MQKLSLRSRGKYETKPSGKSLWTRMNNKVRDFLASMCFSGPSFLGMLAFYIIPFLIVIYYSFTVGLTDHSFAGLKNYINVWQNGAFKIAVKNTFTFTGLSVPLAVVLSLGLALLLEARIPLKSEFRTFFLSPMMVPIASIILIWQVLFHYNGVINEFLQVFGADKIDWLKSDYCMVVIVVLFLWKNLGYNMILFMAALSNIPRELLEVAEVEGASAAYQFFHIKLRYLSPTVLFVTILSIINSFKVFREIYLLTGNYPYDGLYMMQHFMNNMFNSADYQRLSAAACCWRSSSSSSSPFCSSWRTSSERTWKDEEKNAIFPRTVCFLLCAVFALLFLLPTVLTITNSFMTQSEITASYGQVFENANDGKSYISKTIELKFIPDKVSFTQYFTVLLKSPDYLLKFWNSVILTAPIVFAQLMVASIAAYGFTRWRGKVRDSLFFFYVILMLMPYQVTLVPNYLVSDWLKILNTRWAIFLPGAFAPFSVFLLTKFMRRIPMAVIESAKIDGANEWHIFWNICLPQCRSALYSIAILVFIDNWNMVEQPLILLNDVEKQPLSMFLSSINAGEIGIAFAAAVIYMIPGLLLFLHGEAYLVEGIAHSGSVKG